MGWFTITLQIVSFVFGMMREAEGLFSGVAKAGAQKKNYVLTAAKGLVEAMTGSEFSEDLWAKVERAVSSMIDLACVFLFPKTE